MKYPLNRFAANAYFRLFVVAAAIVACLFVIKSTATYGFSQVLIAYSLKTGNLSIANTAPRLTPGDADAHFANGVSFSFNGKTEQAVRELERAVALRPFDYKLWSELGLLRDQTGDVAGAQKAFDEAVRRAPFYSRPRWNRGNLLLRTGEYELAFQDLNQAADSNPSLLQNLMALAWGISKSDIQLTEQLAQINSDERRVALARFLSWKGEGQLALAQYRKAKNVPDETKRELVDQLLAKNAFKEAFEIWNEQKTQNNQSTTSIYDGGFEAPLSFTERAFGWRVPRDLPAITISLDSKEPHSGLKSLRIEFNGDSNPGLSPASQLLLVEPSRRYKVNFSSRSEEIVTGGLPNVIVVDYLSRAKQLGGSLPLEKGTGPWRTQSFEFTTTPQTTAALLILQREGCTTQQCPIFGTLSIDSFSIEQLN